MTIPPNSLIRKALDFTRKGLPKTYPGLSGTYARILPVFIFHFNNNLLNIELMITPIGQRVLDGIPKELLTATESFDELTFPVSHLEEDEEQKFMAVDSPGVIRWIPDVWEDDEHRAVVQSSSTGTYLISTPSKNEELPLCYFKGRLLSEIPERPEITMEVNDGQLPPIQNYTK